MVDFKSLMNAENGKNMLSLIIVKGSQILTVAIPPALPTCIQIGISVALSRYPKIIQRIEEIILG